MDINNGFSVTLCNKKDRKFIVQGTSIVVNVVNVINFVNFIANKEIV